MFVNKYLPYFILLLRKILLICLLTPTVWTFVIVSNITLSFKFNGLVQETANFVDNTDSCTRLELASVTGGILYPCALFWQRNFKRNKTSKVRGNILLRRAKKMSGYVTKKLTHQNSLWIIFWNDKSLTDIDGILFFECLKESLKLAPVLRVHTSSTC